MTLPSDVSNERVVAALVRAGFSIREGGKHTVAWKGSTQVSVPRHRRLKQGTVRAIVRQAGLTNEQFLALL